MARTKGAWGLLWGFLLRPALVAVLFAAFFAFQGEGQYPFRDYLVVSLVFSFVITACIHINTRWIRPLVSPREGATRGAALVREVASYGVASLVGSLIAAVLLHFTIVPGLLSSLHVALEVLLWSLLFGTLFLAVNYFFILQRRYVDHLVRMAEARGREDQELKTAAAIQQALLPPRLFAGSFGTAAGASVSCRTIGGDFFDYFDLGEGRMAFALGDVAGKGPPAAILAAMVQGILASHVTPGVAPSETMGRVNQALLRRKIEARFATLFYGCLDRGGRLTTCNAGHNPAFLLRADGTTSRLDEGGLMIGAFGFASYAEEEVDLHPDDTLVLYSDGVTDAEAPNGEQFSDARLIECLERVRRRSPEAILDSVLDEVRRFAAGQPPADDVTVLVVRYGGDVPSVSAVRTG